MATANHFETVAIEALSLSGPCRRELVSRLLRSLAEDNFDDSENLALVEERSRKLESGEMKTVPYSVVVNEIREKFGI